MKAYKMPNKTIKGSGRVGEKIGTKNKKRTRNRKH